MSSFASLLVVPRVVTVTVLVRESLKVEDFLVLGGDDGGEVEEARRFREDDPLALVGVEGSMIMVDGCVG